MYGITESAAILRQPRLLKGVCHDCQYLNNYLSFVTKTEQILSPPPSASIMHISRLASAMILLRAHAFWTKMLIGSCRECRRLEANLKTLSMQLMMAWREDAVALLKS